MRSVFMVRGEHLTHQGHLFGGDLMAEIDTLRRDPKNFGNGSGGHRLHVLSALNVPSQEPVTFSAQFDFESVHKLFSLGNS